MRRRGSLSSRGRAPLQDDDWLRRRHIAATLEEITTVLHALDVPERDVRRGIRGEVIEIVGDRHRSCVSGRHRAAHADARRDCQVLKRRREVPGLTDDPDRPRWRVRRDDLRAQRDRCRHETLAVGAREQHTEIVGQRHELTLCFEPGRARLAVTGGRDERGADAAACTVREQRRIGRHRRADEDQVERHAGRQVRD